MTRFPPRPLVREKARSLATTTRLSHSLTSAEQRERHSRSRGGGAALSEFFFLSMPRFGTLGRIYWSTIPLVFSLIKGNISVGVTRQFSLERLWVNDVFINVFRDLESNALHFYASLRGMFIAFRLEYLGKVALYPPITASADARFQRSTRRRATGDADLAIAMSLKAACHYTITKLRARSYLMPLSQFCFGHNVSEYSRKIFIPW